MFPLLFSPRLYNSSVLKTCSTVNFVALAVNRAIMVSLRLVNINVNTGLLAGYHSASPAGSRDNKMLLEVTRLDGLLASLPNGASTIVGGEAHGQGQGQGYPLTQGRRPQV
jgi:hypothetical protein